MVVALYTRSIQQYQNTHLVVFLSVRMRLGRERGKERGRERKRGREMEREKALDCSNYISAQGKRDNYVIYQYI